MTKEVIPAVVVMKFGGTSVADAEAIARLVRLVVAERDARGRMPVVVVSAMSGVTDRLLFLAAAAVAGRGEDVAAGVEALRERHSRAVEQLVRPEAAGPAVTAVAAEVNRLAAMLEAVRVLGEASPRSLDGVASSGELLSSAIVAAALAAAGVPSTWLDARRVVVTDDRHTCAAPLLPGVRDEVARQLAPVLRAGAVPVLGGFIGATRAGITTTLGRGGSDYSAAILGAAIHDASIAVPASAAGSAVEVQIWTDVDGMLTADPRVVEGAVTVPRLSFAEASELAYFGAKVLHPSTILPAVERKIPVRILNSRRPEAAGTLIGGGDAERERPLAALACKRGITVIEVTSTRMLMAHGFLRRLFEVFERHATAVDVVTTSEVSVSITVDDDRRLASVVEELQKFADVAVERGMAILCMVGDGLRRDRTLAIRLLATLEGTPLRMVSQAASRRNLTIVVDEAHLAEAMRRLHDRWFAGVDAEVAAS